MKKIWLLEDLIKRKYSKSNSVLIIEHCTSSTVHRFRPYVVVGGYDYVVVGRFRLLVKRGFRLMVKRVSTTTKVSTTGRKSLDHTGRRSYDHRRGTGPMVVGATCHGELRDGVQKGEEMTLNLIRYLAVAEHNGVAANERFCGDGARSTAAGLRWWSFGSVEVRLR